MQTSGLSYTDYQKVISFSADKPKPQKRPQAGHSSPSTLQFKVIKLGNTAKSKPANKRTRTGCLTCRQRKKKCDEHKINGKCQACTRNFLTCGWPVESTPEPALKPPSTSLLSPMQNYSKISVAGLCTPVAAESAYPSPVTTPTIASCKSPGNEVALLHLPPARLFHQGNVDEQPRPEKCEFVITSYNSKRDLCLV